MHALPPRWSPAQQALKAPDHPPKGGKHLMRGLHAQDRALARLGFREPGLQTGFLTASGASTSALAGSIPTWRGFMPSACQNCRTGVGWRAIPVSSVILALASTTVAGGWSRHEASSVER